MMQKQGEEKKNANKVTGTQPLQAQSPDVRERPTAGNKEEKSTSSPPRPALLKESHPKGSKCSTSGPTVSALLNESDPKGRKIVPQGHQDRLYRSSAQYKP